MALVVRRGRPKVARENAGVAARVPFGPQPRDGSRDLRAAAPDIVNPGPRFRVHLLAGLGLGFDRLVRRER